ncbi:prolyl oligopeptidase family serine peptidase [Brevundimonas sp. P7753]|nr:prolyl oligopeptidase family serine peptidase [Brevundimonas sp. P7753]
MAKRNTLAVAGIAFACLLWASEGRAEKRPAVVDDILSMSSFGASSLSPDGRYAVWERQGPYDQGPRFDRDWRSAWSSGMLAVADLEAGSPPRPMAGGAKGLLLGPWSPDGRRLIVYRLVGETAEAGVADARTLQVRWTGMTPDMPLNGAGAGWLDADRFVLSVRPEGGTPWQLRFQTPGAELQAERWRRSREGRTPSRLVLDSRDAAVSADDPVDAQVLMTVRAEDGATTSTLKAPIRDLQTSPNGRWTAVLTQGEATPLRPEERTVQSAVLRRGRLVLVESATGRTMAVDTALDVAPNLLRWSADSREVVVWARRDGQTWREGGLIRVSTDGVTRSVETAGLEPREKGRTIDDLRPARVDWVGDRLLFYARPRDGERFDWWRLDSDGPVAVTRRLASVPDRLTSVGPDFVILVADGGLWRLSATGEIARVVDEGRGLTSAEPVNLLDTVRSRANSAARRTWSPLFEKGRLAAVTNDGGLLWRSQERCGGESRVRAAVGERALLTCDMEGVSTLTVEGPSGRRMLEALNPGFADLELAKPTAITHLDRLGRPTVSYLYRPPGVPAEAIRGVIVNFYPGSVDSGRWRDALSLRSGMRSPILAMGGYAVLSASTTAEDESKRAEMLDDFASGLNLAIDAAMAAAPDLPWSRLALYGHSFGGYGALGVAARTDRFRSYVASSAPTLTFSEWGEPMPVSRLWPNEGPTWNQTIGATERGQAAMGAPPWAAPDAYARASPMLGAPCIAAPVLLITADGDYVPATQAEVMFSALHRLGKRVRLVTYWGEGHGKASPANFRDLHGQIFRWLDETIGASGASGLKPLVPSPHPTLEEGRDKDVRVAPMTDQGVTCQDRLGRGAVNNAERGQPSVEQPGP